MSDETAVTRLVRIGGDDYEYWTVEAAQVPAMTMKGCLSERRDGTR
jgi:hypothetical protein